jgi:hypothetical protein
MSEEGSMGIGARRCGECKYLAISVMEEPCESCYLTPRHERWEPATGNTDCISIKQKIRAKVLGLIRIDQ